MFFHRSNLVLAAIFVSVVVTCKGNLWDGPCELSTSSDPGGDTKQVIPIALPPACKNGSIEWDYPRGSLHLTFDASYEYSLCFIKDWGTYFGGVADLTDGHNTKLPAPTKDNPTCVKSVNHKILVAVVSFDTQYYMSNVKYKIVRN